MMAIIATSLRAGGGSLPGEAPFPFDMQQRTGSDPVTGLPWGARPVVRGSLTVVAVFRRVARSWQVALTACVAGTIVAPLVYGAALLSLGDAADSAYSALVYGVFVFLGPVLIGAGTVVAMALVLPLLSSALRAMRP